MRYKNIFVGGTFDGLHKGHTALLSKAFVYGTKVTVGLTSQKFVRKFKVQSSKFKVKQFIERKQVLKRWLHIEKYTSQATVISIDDPYEPAASGDFDALIVTKDNRDTGEEINRRRKAKGLNKLVLIEVPLVQADDDTPISTTRVRSGEIDGNGRLVMPQSLIPALRKPLGKVVGEKEIRFKIKDLRKKIIVTVGDMTTKTLLDQGIVPDLSVVDGKVGRKPFHDAINMLQPEKASPFQAIAVKSGPGFLATRAIRAVKATLERLARQATRATHVGQGTRARQATQERQEKQVIVVNGEEDLLALPAIIFAPLGSLVLYGQPASPYARQGGPQAGIVIVQIDQKVKNLVQKLMKKFLVSQ